MCGIAGIIRFKGSPLVKRKELPTLKKMASTLRFRGPDDEEVVFDPEVAFIFRRLSIIDIVGGRQPFETKRLLVMCNGEIYNYKDLKKQNPYPYTSQSDCEVILPLYENHGADFLTQLNGMFAIALWDKKKGQVVLARDRLGIKPLFYTVTKKGHLIFGSEIKALLQHPDCDAELDLETNLIRKEIVFNLSVPLTSGFKNINSLPPGSRLVVDLKKETIREERWWELKFPQSKKDKRSANELIQEYGSLLQESVHMQLMSDVEVGLTLSGGIDSVAIAAFASQVKPIETFTIFNQSTFLNGEVESAFQAAKYLGLKNHRLYFPWQEPVITEDLFKEITWALELPMSTEHVFKFLLYKKIKQDFPNLKTLLMGQGSDEFNGGYGNIYISDQMPQLDEKHHAWPLFMGAMDAIEQRERLIQTSPYLLNLLPFLSPKFIDERASFPKIDPWIYYQKQYIRNIDTYNLWHEDRSAAANQIENRVPFLDHRIVEFCASVPVERREEVFWQKNILRKSMEGRIPESLQNRKKVPFYYGLGQRYAFRTMYELIAQNDFALLKESILDNSNVKNKLNVDAVIQGFKSLPHNPTYDGVELFIELVSLGLWSSWVKKRPNIEATETDLEWYPIKDWSKQKPKMERMLGVKSDNICGASILTFAKDYFLVINPSNSKSYIATEEILEFELDSKNKKNYIKLLELIDGKTNLNTLLKSVGIPLESVLPDLEEALEYGVLQIIN